MPEIVKVQVAVAGRVGECVIYDQHRKHTTITVMPIGIAKALKNDLRGYFEAEWAGGAWAIGERIPEQAE